MKPAEIFDLTLFKSQNFYYNNLVSKISFRGGSMVERVPVKH